MLGSTLLPPFPDTAAPSSHSASRQTCSWAHNSCCVATPQLICYIHTASAVCFVSRESKYFQSVQKLVICKSIWLRMMFPRSLNKDLYGPSRVTANTAIKDILLRDHVLREGEWYSDIAKQKPWTTSFAISFEVGDKSLFSFLEIFSSSYQKDNRSKLVCWQFTNSDHVGRYGHASQGSLKIVYCCCFVL